MAPITWRNVDAPSFSGANDALRLSGQLMDSSFSAARDTLSDFQKQRQQDATSLISARALQYQDPAQLRAAIERGEFAGPGMTPEAINFVAGQGQTLLNQENTRAGIASGQIRDSLVRAQTANTQLQGQVAQDEFTRSNEQRAARLAFEPKLTAALSGAMNGDVAGYQKFVTDNAAQFSAAGLDPTKALDNGASFLAASQNAQLARGEFADKMRNRGITNNARDLTALATQSFGSQEEAILAVQGLRSQGYAPELLDATISNLSNSKAWAQNNSYFGGLESTYGVEPTRKSAPAPDWATKGLNTPGMKVADNGVYSSFMGAAASGDPSRGIPGLTNSYGLAALASTVKNESNFSAGNMGKSWADPSVSGQPGTSGELMSWRGPRLTAVRNWTSRYGNTPQEQALFFLQENPKLTAALQNAKSLDEAQRLINTAWAFAGHDNPNDREVQERRADASRFFSQISGQPLQADGSGPSGSTPLPIGPGAGMAALTSNSNASSMLADFAALDQQAAERNALAATRNSQNTATAASTSAGTNEGNSPAQPQTPGEQVIAAQAARTAAVRDATPEDPEATIKLPDPIDQSVTPRYPSQAPIQVGDQTVWGVDENSSQYENSRDQRSRRNSINTIVARLGSRAQAENEYSSNGLVSAVGNLYDSIVAPRETQAANIAGRERAARINDWWDSSDAQEFFQENPQALVQADKDPIGFAETILRQRAQSQPAQTAAPAQAPAAPAPQNPAQAQLTNKPTRQLSDKEMASMTIADMARVASSATNLSNGENNIGDIDSFVMSGAGENMSQADAIKILTDAGLGKDMSDKIKIIQDVQGIAPGKINMGLAAKIAANTMSFDRPQKFQFWPFEGTVIGQRDKTPGVDLEKAKEVYEQYYSDAGGSSGLNPGVERLSLVQKRQDTRAKISKVVSDYEQAKATKDALLTKPETTKAEKARIEAQFTQLEKAMKKQLNGLNASDIITLHSNGKR